eukprot:6391434-Prymnesium_polylepis.1
MELLRAEATARCSEEHVSTGSTESEPAGSRAHCHHHHTTVFPRAQASFPARCARSIPALAQYPTHTHTL